MAVNPFSSTHPGSTPSPLRLATQQVRSSTPFEVVATALPPAIPPPIQGAAMTPEEIATGRFTGSIPPFRLEGVTAALFGTGVYQSQDYSPVAPDPAAPAAPTPPTVNLDSGVLPWAGGEWRRIGGVPGQVAQIQVDVPAGWSGTTQFTMGPIVGTDSGTSSNVWITDGENVVAGPVRGYYHAGITTDALVGGKTYYVCVEYDVPSVMSIGILHNP